MAAVFGCSSDEKKDTEPDAGSSGGSSGSGGGSGDDASAGGSGGGSGGNSTGGSSGSGTGGSTPTDSGPPDSGGPLLLEGPVVDAAVGGLSGVGEPPLEGVEVCVVDADGMKDTDYECDTTGADGLFSIGPLEPNQQIIVAFSKDGYLTQVKAVDVGTAAITLGTPFRMAPTGDAGTVLNFGWDPAVSIDPAKGSLNFFAVMLHEGDGGGNVIAGIDWAPDVTVTIAPDEGDGPFYMDSNEAYRPGATATGEGGYGGWIMNLTPGEYVLTFSHPTLDCAPLVGNAFGWPDGDHSVKVPIIANTNTQSVGVLCTAPTDAGQ